MDNFRIYFYIDLLIVVVVVWFWTMRWSILGLIILQRFYNFCSDIGVTLSFDNLLVDLLNPQSSKTMEIHSWKHIFSNIIFPRIRLCLYPFWIHCFIILNPFGHSLLNCSASIVCTDFNHFRIQNGFPNQLFGQQFFERRKTQCFASMPSIFFC